MLEFDDMVCKAIKRGFEKTPGSRRKYYRGHYAELNHFFGNRSGNGVP